MKSMDDVVEVMAFLCPLPYQPMVDFTMLKQRMVYALVKYQPLKKKGLKCNAPPDIK